MLIELPVVIAIIAVHTAKTAITAYYATKIVSKALDHDNLKSLSVRGSKVDIEFDRQSSIEKSAKARSDRPNAHTDTRAAEKRSDKPTGKNNTKADVTPTP